MNQNKFKKLKVFIIYMEIDLDTVIKIQKEFKILQENIEVKENLKIYLQIPN